jgi:signal transduction histidine kinase
VSSDFERDLRNYGFGLSRQLAAVSEFSTYSGDRETLHRVALAALDETLVTAVAFFDQGGIPIASSGALPAPLTLVPATEQPLLVDADEDRMLFAAPIVVRRYEVDDPFLPEPAPVAWPKQAAAIGWVTLEISREATQQRKNEAVFFTLMSTFAILFLGGGLALVLGRQVTRPILRLENAVARIQEGYLDARVPADSGGDLQRLEEGMNAMAEALSENREFLEARVRIATHKLEQKMNEAERASVAKSRFLAAASHDLRQPLHALSLFAADLRHEADTPARKKLAGHINDSVRSMSELLDSLLDISRLDVAGVTPAPVDFPLADIFQRLDDNYARSAAGKSLRFLCRPTPFWVHTDPALFERLLSNLMSNAIRYSESGGVVLLARQRKDGIRIEVRDSGVGIPAEHHEAVFEEFFQVENVARAQGQGLGLGLAIVRRLARILGLKIELHSVPGRGSIFAVTLPQATPASKPATDEAPDAAAHPAPARLLLLPPETQALRDAAMLASNWGFNSEWAESFDEAQQKARREGMVLVGMAAAYPAGTLKNVSDATAALVLLDCISPLGSAHVLPLPLRPAKLRALLTQLLTVAASPPSPVSSEAG